LRCQIFRQVKQAEEARVNPLLTKLVTHGGKDASKCATKALAVNLAALPQKVPSRYIGTRYSWCHPNSLKKSASFYINRSSEGGKRTYFYRDRTTPGSLRKIKRAYSSSQPKVYLLQCQYSKTEEKNQVVLQISYQKYC